MQLLRGGVSELGEEPVTDKFVHLKCEPRVSHECSSQFFNFQIGHLSNVMGQHICPSESRDGQVPGHQWSPPRGEGSLVFLSWMMTDPAKSPFPSHGPERGGQCGTRYNR